LGALENVTVGDATGAARAVVVEIEHALDTLDIHRQPFEPVSQLGRDRIAFDPTDLLEISELTDLHAVEPNLPAEPPGAQGRALPIILDKANVVPAGIDPDSGEAREVELLAVRRRRLQDDLELIVLLHTVGVFAITAVGRPARGLDIRSAPRLGPKGAECRGRMEGAGPDFDVVGLEDNAALLCPEAL